MQMPVFAGAGPDIHHHISLVIGTGAPIGKKQYGLYLLISTST